MKRSESATLKKKKLSADENIGRYNGTADIFKISAWSRPLLNFEPWSTHSNPSESPQPLSLLVRGKGVVT